MSSQTWVTDPERDTSCWGPGPLHKEPREEGTRQKAAPWSFRNEQQIACLLVIARPKLAKKDRSPRVREGGELRNQRNVLKSALGIRRDGRGGPLCFLVSFHTVGF